MPIADAIQSSKQVQDNCTKEGGGKRREGVCVEGLREVNHFLIILVDNLVKPLVFPEVVQVGIFPDLIELLKPRSQGSLQCIQTCVYLHTTYSKHNGLSD